MLDEIHDSPLEQAPTDHNNYCLGRIQNHNIVIACSPNYGPTSAAVAAEQMLHSFQEIRFGLMVGIGGGVPGPKTDIRLGDVVISRPEGALGGVVQYDSGKTIKDAQFQRIGSLEFPPRILQAAVNTLRSTHEMEDSSIPGFLQEMFTNYPKMKSRYASPGPEKDLLFNEDYDHANPALTCVSCDTLRLIPRQARDSSDPHIHYGLIASGNQVIKHGLTRSRYGKELGVICFEMEAAGLMNSFKCLVIRGISDYCDSHKNDEWQHYAAATAAAYAKELLIVTPAQRVHTEKPITGP